MLWPGRYRAGVGAGRQSDVELEQADRLLHRLRRMPGAVGFVVLRCGCRRVLARHHARTLDELAFGRGVDGVVKLVRPGTGQQVTGDDGRLLFVCRCGRRTRWSLDTYRERVAGAVAARRRGHPVEVVVR